MSWFVYLSLLYYVLESHFQHSLMIRSVPASLPFPFTRAVEILASMWWKYCYFGWLCGEAVWIEFNINLGIRALLPFDNLSQSFFTKSRSIIGQYLQFSRLVRHFHDLLSSARMILWLQSALSVRFGMPVDQISCGADFMPIRPQENISLMQIVKLFSSIYGLDARQNDTKGTFNLHVFIHIL